MNSLPADRPAPSVDASPVVAARPAKSPQSSRRQVLAAAAASLLASPAGLLGDTESFKVTRRDEREIGRVLSPEGSQIRRTFRAILEQEEAHVAYLKGLITGTPRPTPTFQNLKQSSLEKFAKAARDIEGTVSGGYANVISSFNSFTLQNSVMPLVSMEGRHAGYVTGLTSIALNTTGTSVEDQLSATEVRNVLLPFVVSLNGGTAVTYSNIRSDLNDQDILNFLLFMEQLEFAFFQINVQKFFL